MHYCNKCGEKIVDVTKPCPTCGLKNDNSNNFIITNGKTYFSLLVIIVVILFGCGLFFIRNSFSSIMIDHIADNYSLTYDNIVWTEYEVGEGVYALINNSDKDIFLQFPVVAEELGFALNSEENCEAVYDAYVVTLNKAVNLDYNNISSGIKRLDGTDYYYLTADYISYDNTSRGKLYVILTEDGKAINVLLTLGSNSILDVEEDIYDILRSIRM